MKNTSARTKVYCTSYCNKGHRVKDGTPVRHECGIIPPAALRAEMADDFELAIRLMSETMTAWYGNCCSLV